MFEEITTQIPTTKIQPFSPTGVSELKTIERYGGNRFSGDCPASRAHMADGTLYTGFYPYKKWIIKEVVPHHDAIHANRKQGGGSSTKKVSIMKKKANLRAQISELESTKCRMISKMKTRP